MNLQEVLQMVALQTMLDPDQLNQFAAEDSIGGWDLNHGGWPIGSLWSVEGKAFYALVRALQPDLVVEIGTHRGCSTTHIATALEINGKGEVVTIDLAEEVGDLIPPNLSGRVSKVSASGIVWLAEQPDESIDIIYEDADHSAETSRDVAQLATKKLKSGGLLIVHDAAHDYAWVGDGQQITSPVGATIRSGLDFALGGSYRVYCADPSDCGFAIWQQPGTPKAKGLPADDGYSYPAGDVQAGAIEKSDGFIHSIGRDPETGKPVKLVSDGKAYQAQEMPAAPDFEGMSKDELKAYAKKHKISLTGARTIPQIIAKIVEAETAAGEPKAKA